MIIPFNLNLASVEDEALGTYSKIVSFVATFLFPRKCITAHSGVRGLRKLWANSSPLEDNLYISIKVSADVGVVPFLHGLGTHH